jgi:hypothetical protein
VGEWEEGEDFDSAATESQNFQFGQKVKEFLEKGKQKKARVWFWPGMKVQESRGTITKGVTEL